MEANEGRPICWRIASLFESRACWMLEFRSEESKCFLSSDEASSLVALVRLDQEDDMSPVWW